MLMVFCGTHEQCQQKNLGAQDRGGGGRGGRGGWTDRAFIAIYEKFYSGHDLVLTSKLRYVQLWTHWEHYIIAKVSPSPPAIIDCFPELTLLDNL